MSIWDDFKKFAESLNPLGGFTGQQFVSGEVTRQAGAAGVSPEVAASLGAQAGGLVPGAGIIQPVVATSERIQQKMEPVVTKLDQFVYKPTYEALSAAALAANEDTYKGRSIGETLVEDGIDGFTEGLARAWQGRKDISFGQAVADLAAQAVGDLPDWGALAEAEKVDINIYDKEMRDRVYSRNYNADGQRIDSAGNVIADTAWIENVWRVISGTVDVTKQLVADPLWLGGKAAKAARLSTLDVARTSIMEPEAAAAFAREQVKYADDTFAVLKEKNRLLIEEPELQRAQEMLAEMDKGMMHPDSVIAELNYVREASGFGPVKPSTSADMAIAQYRNYVKKLEATQSKRLDRIEQLNAVEAPKPKLARGVGEFVTQVVARQMKWDEIAQHTTLRNFAVDAEFLAKALETAAPHGEAAVTDVLLMAQMSDPSAMIRLQSKQKNLLTLIDDAQNRMDYLETEIQRALHGSDTVTAARLNANKARTSEYIQALRAEDQHLDLLLRTDNSIAGTLPTMPFSNGRLSPIIERYRANRAIVRAGLQRGEIKPLAVTNKPEVEFEWTRVQGGPLHRATYVANWIGHRVGLEKPSGMVTKDGLDYYDGVKELQVYLNDIKEFVPQSALKTQLMDDYVSAKNVIERDKVLDKVESEVFRTLAEKYGIENEVVINESGKEQLAWEMLYQKFLKERAQQIEQYKRDKVFGVDSNNTLIANPIVESQLDYARPMLPVNELDAFLALHAEDISAFRVLLANVRQVNGEWILPSWAAVDRLWRADVLLRLGYPQRNVLGEGVVLAQYDTGLSGLFSVGEVTASAGRFISNRYAQFQDIGARMQAGMDMLAAEGVSKNLLKAVRVRWSEYEQYVGDLIQGLRETRKGILDDYEAMSSDPDMGFIAYPTSTIERLDAQIAAEEAKLAKVAERVAARGERFGLRRTRGQELVRIGPYEFAGVFEGQQGKAVRNLTSSSGRLGFDASPYASALKEMGLTGTGTWKAIQPGSDTYFPTLAKIVNQDLRGSTTARMLLTGSSFDEVVAYLNTRAGQEELSKLGWIQDVLPAPADAKAKRLAGQPPDVKIKEAGKKKKVSGLELLMFETPEENYVHFMQSQIIERYLPNDSMRQLVRERLTTDELGRGGQLVTSADLRLTAKDTPLNPIHGEQMESRSIFRNPALSPAEKLNTFLHERMLKKLYTWLGTYPEDAIITHPFADAVYQAKLNEIVDVFVARGIPATNEEMLQAQTIARKWAVRQSREFLYRVVRKNGIANSMGLLAPFFQASYSTIHRTGRLAYRNPEKSARLVYAWNQINTNSYEDENGQKWLIFRIPPSWYDDKGVSSVVPETLRTALKSQDQFRWHPEAFNLLLAGLRIPTEQVLPGQEETPLAKMSRWATAAQSIFGTGPVAQMAANVILNNDPSINKELSDKFGFAIPAREFLEIWASPFPTEHFYDPLLSGWNKRVISLWQKDGNTDFERTKLVMYQNHLDRIRTGEEDPLSPDELKNNELLWELASKEAAAFIGLRLTANLTAAFIPTYEGPLTAYVELYRKYQEKYGVKAYDTFLRDYPDLGYIAVSRSKNLAGASQATDSVYLREKWDSQIERALSSTGLSRENSLPFVQMIVNGEVGEAVLRDPRAAYWQRKQGDRIVLTAEQGYENEQIREGWAKYMTMTEEYNAALQKMGISRYSDAAEYANQVRRNKILQLGKENPEWYQEYSVGVSGTVAVGFVRAMKTMLEDKDFTESLSPDSYWWDISGILQERDDMIAAAREMGLASPSKAMKQTYEARIKVYLQDPTAAYYFNKFLDNDNFAMDQPR